MPTGKRAPSLARAIALAGSPAALAALIGVRPATVRSWVKKGITPGGSRLLEQLRERLKLQEAEERGKRQTFDLLFKLAGERGDLRKGRSREGVRAGPRTSGYQWVMAVNEMASIFTIERIDAWIMSQRRRFPLFQAVAVATEYTKQKFKGYKTVMHQVPNVEESGDFAVEEQIATKRSTSLTEVRDELVSKLEDALEEGALVYIHEVTLFNYRMRTEEERMAWESGKRQARKKRAKRRAKKQSAVSDQPSAKKKAKKKTWPKTKTLVKPSKPSKTTKTKMSKSTKATATGANLRISKKSKKEGASRSKSASTRSQPTRSNSKRANAKPSRPKTSSSRSTHTTSKKSTKKPRSSLVPSKSRATSKTQAKTVRKTKAKTRHS